MKRWFRRILMVLAVVALTLGILYESATHVGRGWLFGEAFFDGRPTSYWRSRIDRWIESFESPEDAEKALNFVQRAVWSPETGNPKITEFEIGGDRVSGMTEIELHGTTFWMNLKLRLEFATGCRTSSTPEVLTGWGDAEPVLCELNVDHRYHSLIALARRNVAVIKRDVCQEK